MLCFLITTTYHISQSRNMYKIVLFFFKIKLYYLANIFLKKVLLSGNTLNFLIFYGYFSV
jgi:hypothetical protein